VHDAHDDMSTLLKQLAIVLVAVCLVVWLRAVHCDAAIRQSVKEHSLRPVAQ